MQVVLLLGFAPKPNDTPCPLSPVIFSFTLLGHKLVPLSGVGCIYSRQAPTMRIQAPLSPSTDENLPLTLVSLGDADSGAFSAICIPEVPAGLITVFGRVGDRANWLLEGAR